MLRRVLPLFVVFLALPVLAQDEEVRQVLAHIEGEWDWVETRLIAGPRESILTPETEGYSERVVFDVQHGRGGSGRMLRDGELLAEDGFDLQNNAQPADDWVWMDWGDVGEWWVQLVGNTLVLHADSAGGPRISYVRRSVDTQVRSVGQIKSDYSQR